MERKWKTLNKKLQRQFYLNHCRKRLMKSFIKASVVFNALITGGVIYLTHNILFALIGIGCSELLALGAVQRRINLLHRRVLKSTKLYGVYENETRRILLDMYYNCKISHNIYAGYFLYKRAEQNKVEVNKFIQNDKKRRIYLENKVRQLRNNQSNAI